MSGAQVNVYTNTLDTQEENVGCSRTVRHRWRQHVAQLRLHETFIYEYSPEIGASILSCVLCMDPCHSSEAVICAWSERGLSAHLRGIAAFALLACGLRAQPVLGSAAIANLSGTVRDSVTSRPIAGAVVMLLDSSRTVLVRNITDERGLYRVSTTASARYLRVVRIGFQPRELGINGRAGGAQSLDVTMVQFSTALAPVRVAEKTRCPRRPDAAAAAALWEQARAGLLATVVAREANPAGIYRFAFERTFDVGSDRITRFLVFADSAAAAVKSFTAVSSAQRFVETGFSKDSADIQLLFAPDADVLLDDAFGAGYCFRLARQVGTRPHEVGLSFSPAEREHGRVDIDGTLWLDTAARALTDIEYGYVGLPKTTDVFHPGGLISFRSMANGTALIDRWKIRRVDTEQDTIRDGSNVGVRYLHYATENGGELARAVWPDGQSWRASLGSIEVHALSSGGKPVSGALLALAGTTYRATTDSAGHASIHELIPGPYALDLIDPRLARLGLSIPTGLEFVAGRDSVIHANAKIQTAEEYIFGKCFAKGHYSVCDNWVLVAGRVVASDDKPIDNARMSFNLPGSFKSDSAGVFQFCAHRVAGVDTLMLSVRIDDGSSSPVRVADVSRAIPDALTVIPIKVGAAVPAVTRP
jgi:hypothetical protein